MADAKKLVPFILKWEGGYTNDPVDRGGATNKGITLVTYKALGRWDNNKDGKIDEKDLKLLSEDQWYKIYKQSFWDKWRADDIKNQSIANILVDWIWTSGKYGITNVQKVLGVKDDGIVGPKTIEAVNNYKNQKELFNKIKDIRLKFVENIVKNNPSQKKFINGRKRRINAFTYDI